MPGPFQGALNQVDPNAWTRNAQGQPVDPQGNVRSGNIITDTWNNTVGRIGRAPQQTPGEQDIQEPGTVRVPYGPPDIPAQEAETARTTQLGKDQVARADATQVVELETLQTQLKVAQAALEKATSPETREAASLAVELAKVNLATAQLQLKQAQDPGNSPKELAILANELNIKRDQLQQRAAAVLADEGTRAAWDQLVETQRQITERQNTQIEATAAEGQKNRDVQTSTAALQAGTAVRGQDTARLDAVDSFNASMTANKIKAGELSVDRAYKMLETDIAQRRLPSEIARNLGEAIAPMVPHLSAYKKGGIPNGFESGGPFETAMRQGGAQSYDPSAYAVNPVGIDIMGMAKKAGAQVPTGPMLSPGSIPDPQINTDIQPSPIPANLQIPDNYLTDIAKQLQIANQQGGNK